MLLVLNLNTMNTLTVYGRMLRALWRAILPLPHGTFEFLQKVSELLFGRLGRTIAVIAIVPAIFTSHLIFR